MNPTRTSTVLALFTLITLLAGCASNGSVSTASDAPLNGKPAAAAHAVSPSDTARLSQTTPVASDRVRLYVNGMGCPLCVTNVDKQLARIPGVRSSTVNLGDATVDVELYSKNRPSPAQFNKALSGDVTLVKIEELK